ASEEMSATSEELAAQAEELQTSITYFQLAAPTPGAGRKAAPVARLMPARVAAKPTMARPAPRKVAARGPVGAQQARAQGFALDLSQGGPDHADSEFTEY
ncbi:MAG: methyl-accepting chemotaxis protein, partial [bacterium]|nr:methyl-accepting chemotaxis protein [bacterium]